MNIVFVTPDLYSGGAVASMRRMGQNLRHSGASVAVLCLGSLHVSNWASFEALGMTLADPASLGEADAVIVFFWNTPAMHMFIKGGHPPMRVVVRPCIEGSRPPHVITKDVVAFADALWSTASSTLAIPELSAVPRRYLPNRRDLSAFQPRPKTGRGEFVAGYLGTVDFVKMHRDYVAMSAAAGGDMIFEIWGSGRAGSSILAEAARLGRRAQFHVMGATSEPEKVLSRFDAFGYPLCADSYAANDGVLLEAMAVGLPSVVFDIPGNRDYVENGETALVVQTSAEYANALAALQKDRDLRERIGANAANFVRKWHSNLSQDDLFSALSDVMSIPKRTRNTSMLEVETGADLFVRSLGRFATPFSQNLNEIRTTGNSLEGSERVIAASSPGMNNPGAGGLHCYRAFFPADPVLRYWSGLVFAHTGRPATALAEFLAAKRGGFAPEIIARHIESATRECVEQEVTREPVAPASGAPDCLP